MRAFRRLAVVAALSAFAALGIFGGSAASPASAVSSGTSDFTFDSFNADYTLSRGADGIARLDVVETIVARFPSFDQNRGIIRSIPDDYDGTALSTTVASVTDENGTPVPFTETPSGGFLELALGTDAFVHGVVTYVITYSQTNVIRAFADTGSDEFYWDVNGTGWDQPFARVSALVHVDPALTSALSGNAACYVGAQGSTKQCPLSAPTAAPPPTDSTAPDPTATTSRAPAATDISATVTNLGPGETVTISIGFASGTFTTPPPPTPIVYPPIDLGTHLASGGLGLASLGVLGAAIAARLRSRGPRGRGVIIPEYSEPKDITILQAAHFVGRPATAIPAALVRLAVRRNIRILAYETVLGGEPYSLQYLGSGGANAEDAELLERLFGQSPTAGEVKEFGQSDQDLMRSLTALSDDARKSLVTTGLQRRAPGRGLAALLVVAQVIMGVVAIGLAVTSIGRFDAISGLLGPTMLVGTAAAIATMVLATRPLQPTETGVVIRDYLLGMKMYLTIAEQDRLRALQSPTGAERVDAGDNLEMVKLYEKLLPWAVIWGVEDQWMRELAVRVEALPQQPDWFVGSSGFNPLLFTSAVHGFSSALVPPVTVSSWSGSGGGSFGGGSFGGGFSGGGGGGGGGGGR